MVNVLFVFSISRVLELLGFMNGVFKEPFVCLCEWVEHFSVLVVVVLDASCCTVR